MGIKPNIGIKVRKLEKRVDRMSVMIKELREAWVHIGNNGRQPQVPGVNPQQGNMNEKRVNLKG